METDRQLVGRSQEQRRLVAAISGRAHTVVSGPAGVGKTALVAEAMRHVGARPVTVQGLRLGSHVPLLPFWSVLGGGATGDAVRRELADLDPAAPLVVDGAQWLDETSRHVVEEQTRRRAVVTIRRSAPWLVIGSTAAQPDEVVAVHPLSDEDAHRLARNLGPELADEQVAALRARSAGYPAILVGLARGDHRIRTVLGGRLRRLSPPAGDAVVRALAGSPVLLKREPHAVTEVVTAGLGRVADGALQVAEVLRELPVHRVAARGERSTSVPARRHSQDPQLTPRERQVLDLVARGASNAAIAAELAIGVATVESHVRSAMGKLGARNRVQAARLASR